MLTSCNNSCLTSVETQSQTSKNCKLNKVSHTAPQLSDTSKNHSCQDSEGERTQLSGEKNPENCQPTSLFLQAFRGQSNRSSGEIIDVTF